jgi:HAD superfamily hydrolase (TIGR01509 family)
MIDLARIDTIFLDDGGVMNDNTLRGPEWQRLVGEFLAPRLGGAPEAWGEANRIVFGEIWREFEEFLLPTVEADSDTYTDFFVEQRVRWLCDMCARVGVPAPRDCLLVAVETEQYVLPRVRSAYPGAADAIKTLHARGYRLGTASGASSVELHGYLTGLGVRELFSERLYGQDLVRAMKGTSHYYNRIFADAALDPADTIVVDDAAWVLDRAAEAGAQTVLVSTKPQDSRHAHIVIKRLGELPALLG